ncbi:NAD(P)H-hydrate dehydratase [Qipengyuania sp. 6D47A]|uniref:Bifunctional NAD(P)H-hydrate repair enzyme n=2 Tax=Qipengyuania qiaonensis TaxID=2867240 RepID=A0ABS7J681_9SPHN|nr:NAD(P)H-hydrate dehydratase [Qipengyuania qiaonensis]MBX7481138.1 NAD(P)H-hydrate dehydratase [Qipengyuania qiaonensis]
MRAAERATMDGGTSEWELMQRAGQGAAQWVMRVAGGRPVTVLCGPGNNGGDGYVIAEVLRRDGHEVQVIAPIEATAKTARIARAHFGGEVVADGTPRGAVVVDCLFGYGLTRQVEGSFGKLLEKLDAYDCYKIAIDVPSAVDSDTGTVLGPLPRYDLTLALGAWKQGHFLMPAMASMGAKRLVSIGLDIRSTSFAVSTSPHIAPPPSDAHKYRRGLLAIVAGAMPGAPMLAVEAAMRAGAGYVKLLSERPHPEAPAELVVEQDDLAAALSDERISALLVGPGLGRDDTARKRLARVLAKRKPTVLDADALHLLGPRLLDSVDVATLCLTPHEGELASLCETFDIAAESKLERARALHDITGMTVLAKGPDTILVSDATTRFFPQGSSWLSTAGTGDVLAGIVASRLAVHGEPLRACEEAVWLHHEAARLASPAFSVGDLARSVKPAMAAFL